VVSSFQYLNHTDIHLLFQQVGSEAVAQGMHRNALVNLRLICGSMNGAVELTHTEWIDRILSGKQPAAVSHLALCMGIPPPDAQLFEQDRGEHGVTILAAFALFDAQCHALAIDITYLECAHLAHTQTCAVGDRQRRLVFQVARCGKQTCYLFATQHHRQFVRNAYRLHFTHQLGTIQRVLEQELQAAEGVIDRDRRGAVIDHVQLVEPQILGSRSVGGSLEISCKLPHCADIADLRLG
jgi:hypothetical protein